MSIVKIAELAGVSHSTVSRVINENPGVSIENKQKVQRVMKDLNFVPRPRNSRPGPRPSDRSDHKTGQIMLLYSNIEESEAMISPATIMLAKSIQSKCAENGMSMAVSFVDRNTDFTYLCNTPIDGFILVGDDPSSELSTYLEKYVVVGVFSNLKSQKWDCVHIDNEAVCRMAVERLITKGHKHIGLLDVLPQRKVNRLRANYFKHIAAEYGVKASIVLSEHRADDPNGPREISFDTDELVEQMYSGDFRPTGLFVPGDIFMSFTLQEITKKEDELGIEIELITTNQNVRDIKKYRDKITIIDCKPDCVGKRAVEQLLWKQQRGGDPETILVRPEIQTKGVTDKIEKT